jgi:hypothetical protein
MKYTFQECFYVEDVFIKTYLGYYILNAIFLTPGLWQKFSHGRCSHLSEESSAMNTAKM